MATAKQSITLPSKGILYEGRVPDGKITIRKLTAAEEALLSGSGGSIVDKISKIIEACSELPNAFKHKDLLLTDRMAILLALRTFTFGARYTYPFQCGTCRATNQEEVDIAEELATTWAKDDLREPIEVRLVDAEQVAQVRFMRGTDEEAMVKYTKRFELRSSDALDQSQIHRVARLLVAVDGGDLGDIVKREDYVRQLTAADLIRLENAIDDAEPGVDLSVAHECAKCGAVNKGRMPFNAEFFRPARM